MKRRVLVMGMIVTMMFGIMACSSNSENENDEAKDTKTEETAEAEMAAEATEPAEETEIQVFIAASLNTVMSDIANLYQEKHPNVKVTFNADSSGTLLTQIQEGYECDIFFSAAQKQMDQLEADKFIIDGSRANVVNNKVVLVTLNNCKTKVTSLENLQEAESIALAGGSVPVGKYTRQALINLGIMEKTDEPDAITTQEISNALGGVEISEQDNVSKVLAAVVEGSCEVGTTYYSDTYGYENDLTILQEVSYDLTGNVIYPICLVSNSEADQQQKEEAQNFYDYILSDEAKVIFDQYYFDTNVDR